MPSLYPQFPIHQALPKYYQSPSKLAAIDNFQQLLFCTPDALPTSKSQQHNTPTTAINHINIHSNHVTPHPPRWWWDHSHHSFNGVIRGHFPLCSNTTFTGMAITSSTSSKMSMSHSVFTTDQPLHTPSYSHQTMNATMLHTHHHVLLAHSQTRLPEIPLNAETSSNETNTMTSGQNTLLKNSASSQKGTKKQLTTTLPSSSANPKFPKTTR